MGGARRNGGRSRLRLADLYVANDGNPNQLWINQKNGVQEQRQSRGCAMNVDGVAAGMGIDMADFDGNGTEDIFLTHLTHEKSTLFVNRGDGFFEDRSIEVGVAAPSIPFTGFGTAFLDYDNDGWLDIVAANGAVHLIEELRQKGDPFALHQKKQLFHNLGNGKFEESTQHRDRVRAVESPRPRGRGSRQRRRHRLRRHNNNGTLRISQPGGAAGWGYASLPASACVRCECRAHAQVCHRFGAGCAPTATICPRTIRGYWSVGASPSKVSPCIGPTARASALRHQRSAATRR